jgi:hypothetical protein
MQLEWSELFAEEFVEGLQHEFTKLPFFEQREAKGFRERLEQINPNRFYTEIFNCLHEENRLVQEELDSICPPTPPQLSIPSPSPITVSDEAGHGNATGEFNLPVPTMEEAWLGSNPIRLELQLLGFRSKLRSIREQLLLCKRMSPDAVENELLRIPEFVSSVEWVLKDFLKAEFERWEVGRMRGITGCITPHSQSDSVRKNSASLSDVLQGMHQLLQDEDLGESRLQKELILSVEEMIGKLLRLSFRFDDINRTPDPIICQDVKVSSPSIQVIILFG